MILIFAICMLLLRSTKLNPIWVMVLAGVMEVSYVSINIGKQTGEIYATD